MTQDTSSRRTGPRPSTAFGVTSRGSLARLGRSSGTEPSGYARAPRIEGAAPAHSSRPGARQETLRESNLLLLTEEIFSAVEPLSRADLALRTGMTRSTVSRLVDDLLAAGIIREGSPVVGGGSRGRPAVPLHPARATLAGLGVEISVDFMAARVLDLTGETLAEEIIDGDFRGSDPQEVLPRAGSMAIRVARAAEARGATVVGTVLALPGLIGADEHSLVLAPNLGWRGVDAVPLLVGEDREVFGGFIHAANEAKLAALAVAQELAAADQQEQTFLYVSAQMGIGAAVVIESVVDVGQHGWAGEIGHISVEPAGPQCGCGALGCLETYAGKRSLLAAADMDHTATAEELVARSQRDDDAGRTACAAIDRAGWALGVALAGAMNLLDVHDIVLGGVYGPLADMLRPRIEEELNSRVLSAQWSTFRVRTTAGQPAPAATGGALRAMRCVVDAPLQWVPQPL
ncbi:ROK family protein [Nesterenkonia lutea]|uniref:NBD/HSP70 family sugar kinase n=1 Tax=Nesterenkonia lutea TaxID=272919 RepID=A0ABR9JGL5_9MICC|nr:ROK family protein [Nesterenkonia lutea]MBE1525069.1 putative NBD/HSP70 family sugar kinase [Nesterenkonia lutea]